MIFTGYRQPSFFDLHDIYRISTAPLFQFTWYLQGFDSPPFSIYVVFTGSRQPPFFQFTWHLQCYLQDLDSPPFIIYVVFTGSRQPPLFNLHGFYNVIYRILAATLLQFTWYLKDLGRLSHKFTRYLQDLESPPFSIYMIFTGSREPLLFQFT